MPSTGKFNCWLVCIIATLSHFEGFPKDIIGFLYDCVYQIDFTCPCWCLKSIQIFHLSCQYLERSFWICLNLFQVSRLWLHGKWQPKGTSSWYALRLDPMYPPLVISLQSIWWDKFADPLKTPLNWRRRLQIAVDVAAALVCDWLIKLIHIFIKKKKTFCDSLLLAIA